MPCIKCGNKVEKMSQMIVEYECTDPWTRGKKTCESKCEYCLYLKAY